MFTHRNISQTTIVIHVQSINNNYVNIFVYVTLLIIPNYKVNQLYINYIIEYLIIRYYTCIFIVDLIRFIRLENNTSVRLLKF